MEVRIEERWEGRREGGRRREGDNGMHENGRSHSLSTSAAQPVSPTHYIGTFQPFTLNLALFLPVCLRFFPLQTALAWDCVVSVEGGRCEDGGCRGVAPT